MRLTVRRPRFRGQVQVEALDPGEVVVTGADGRHVLRGPLFHLLVPYIDGRRTTADIAERLDGRLTPLDVRYGFELLAQSGLVVESDDPDPRQEEVPAVRPRIDARAAQWRLAERTVSVLATGSTPAGDLVDCLRAMGVRIAAVGDLAVVIVDDYRSGRLREHGRRFREERLPWLIVNPVGLPIWLGPLFVPGVPPCWSCLEARLDRGSRTEAPSPRSGECGDPATLTSAGVRMPIAMALQLAATQIHKWIVQGSNAELEGRILTFDPRAMRVEEHAVPGLADCPTCGAATGIIRDPAPIVLRRRDKVYCSDGGHRSEYPERTWSRLRHHLSPITGIVTRPEPVHPETSKLLHVYVAASRVAPLQDATGRPRSGWRRSAGKGMTPLQARVGALCEALERHCGVFRGDEPRRAASCRALKEMAIHPNDCMLFSDDQYDRRDDWNRVEARENWVPERFDEDRAFEWTPAWSLTSDTWKYVPTQYCYYGYPEDRLAAFCRADSSGNAAGNALEEAILQGFLELVERDCVAVWWYNRIQRPGVVLESFGEPYFLSLRDGYQAMGRPLWVLDISSDLGIPAFAAVSGSEGRLRDAVFGFGAHLDAKLAVSRALTEMNQLLHGARPNSLHGRPGAITGDGETDRSYLRPDDDVAGREYRDFRGEWSMDLREDVRRCVALAATRGMETLVVDQTRAGIDLSVVKIIVPGLRPFWARFAPGRLYQVPVHMGWRERPLVERELNPCHLYL